jgi:hypothetical protein
MPKVPRVPKIIFISDFQCVMRDKKIQKSVAREAYGSGRKEKNYVLFCLAPFINPQSEIRYPKWLTYDVSQAIPPHPKAGVIPGPINKEGLAPKVGFGYESPHPAV